jgi:hypothetical protein
MTTEVMATSFPVVPSQLRVKLPSVCSGPIVSVPVAPFSPDQAPDAWQLLTDVPDQLSVIESPALTVGLLLLRLSLEAGGGGSTLILTV